MTKLEFILALQKELANLPQEELQQRLTFYSEMIEDRVEEGLSEEEAVAQIGSVEEIASQILAEYTQNEPATVEEIPVMQKEKTRRKIKNWELVLLILSSPLWISLLIAALSVAFSVVVSVLAVVFSAIVSLWPVVISLWAVFASMAACAVALPIGAVCYFCIGDTYPGIAAIGIGFVCIGLAILSFYACKALTKGTAALTVKTVMLLKRLFTGKEKG